MSTSPANDCATWKFINKFLLVPWQEVVIENDERFIIAEPEPAPVNESEPREPSIWDDLWPGTDKQVIIVSTNY